MGSEMCIRDRSGASLVLLPPPAAHSAARQSSFPVNDAVCVPRVGVGSPNGGNYGHGGRHDKEDDKERSHVGKYGGGGEGSGGMKTVNVDRVGDKTALTEEVAMDSMGHHREGEKEIILKESGGKISPRRHRLDGTGRHRIPLGGTRRRRRVILGTTGRRGSSTRSRGQWTQPPLQ